MMRAVVLLAATLFAGCGEHRSSAGGATPPRATASAPAPAAASAEAPASAEPPKYREPSETWPPEEIAVTREGLLLVSRASGALSAARCGEPDRPVGRFTDPRNLVPSPEGDAVYWLSFEGIRRLDVATWEVQLLPPRPERPQEALAVDQDAAYVSEDTPYEHTVVTTYVRNCCSMQLLILPRTRVQTAHASRRYLWLQMSDTLSRTKRDHEALTPERVTRMAYDTKWDVIAEADAALVIEGGLAFVYQGSPPARKALPLPAPAREICVGGPRTLYWIDGDERVRRTALTPSLTAGATEVVATGEAPRGLACARDHVAWLYGPEKKPQVAHRRTGANAVTCR